MLNPQIVSLLLLREKKFTTRGPSTSTRHCFFRLSSIAENSPLLPPVGVWAVNIAYSGVYQWWSGRSSARKSARRIPKGVIHVQASFNNTIVTVTDVRGRRGFNSLVRGDCTSSKRDLRINRYHIICITRTDMTQQVASITSSIDGAIQVRSNVDPTFYSLVGSGRFGGDHHGSYLLDNPYIPYQCMDSYLSSTCGYFAIAKG
ncbi:hypothetical protein V6N11_010639 [Hibiscus sabdariffa]|uniref:Uncharacterized protein ycf68 n=1 Tax=Hibiscus sabdariffa TaxID=183260 RepID=A0ABR2S5V0_9ROSI